MKTKYVKNTRIYRERYKNANGTAVDRWAVRLGRRFTHGKPQKKRFEDYAAARDWLLEEVAKKQQQGSGASARRGRTEARPGPAAARMAASAAVTR